MENREGPGRRKADNIVGMLSFKNVSGFIVTAGAVAGVVAALLGVLGIKLIGPEEAVIEMQEELKESSINNFNAISSLEGRVKRVEDIQELQTYLLCVQIRRSDPSMLPPGCTAAMVAPPPNTIIP